MFVSRSSLDDTHAEMAPERIAADTPMVTLNTGQHMPLFGLGTSGINGEQCTESVRQAIQLGYRVCITNHVVSSSLLDRFW